MNNKDLFLNILSFLQPLQIVKMRYLSSYHNKWCDTYLKKNMKGKSIEKYACPFCGNFINNDDISNYTGFYYEYGGGQINEEHRIGEVEERLSNSYIEIERKPILCEECERKEDEEEYFDEYEINTMMKYRGNREYKLNSMNNWTMLSIIDYNDGKIYWDEYRKIILPDMFDYVYDRYEDDSYSIDIDIENESELSE